MNGFIVIVPFKKGFGANGPTITLYYTYQLYTMLLLLHIKMPLKMVEEKIKVCSFIDGRRAHYLH